jgi:hypothetical protein
LLGAFHDVISEELPDRAYVDVPPLSPFVFGAMFDLESHALELQTTLPLRATNVWGKELPDLLPDMVPLVSPSAAALLGGKMGSVIRLLELFSMPNDIKLAIELLFTYAVGRQDDATFLAWIPEWNKGGRVMGLRIPSIAMAVEMSDSFAVADVMQPFLLRFNRQTQQSWGYIPYGENGVQALVAPPRHLYGRIRTSDRVGVATWNGLLFLHSSAASLDSFLESVRGNRAQNPMQLPLHAGYMAFGDLPACADLLDNGVASYVLWQFTQGMPRDRLLERMLKQVAEGMRGYDTFEIEVQGHASGHGKAVVRITQEVRE